MDFTKLYLFKISVCSEFGDVVDMNTGELLFSLPCKNREFFEAEYISPCIQQAL